MEKLKARLKKKKKKEEAISFPRWQKEQSAAFTSGAKRSVLSPRRFIDIAVRTIRKLERGGGKRKPDSIVRPVSFIIFLDPRAPVSSLLPLPRPGSRSSSTSTRPGNLSSFKTKKFSKKIPFSSKDLSFGLFLKLKISNRPKLEAKFFLTLGDVDGKVS